MKYYLENNHFYLRDVITKDGTIKSQQKFRMDNSFTNISINYKSDIGYLAYDMAYNLNGSMTVYGEIYYQGADKFLAKEFVQVLNGKPYEIAKNSVTEINFGLQNVLSKTVFGVSSYTNIREQKMNEFAKYANETNKIVCLNCGEDINLAFYN